MQKLHVLVRHHHIEMILTGMPDAVSKTMDWCADAPDVSVFTTLEAALSSIEDRILQQAGRSKTGDEASAFAKLIEDVERAGHAALFPLRSVAAGEALFLAGEPADSVVFLETGHLSAMVAAGGGERTRVARFLEGAVVGELGYYGDMPRTADIVAETASVIRLIPHSAIQTLETVEPELATRLHALLARLMATRLARTTALLHAVRR